MKKVLLIAIVFLTLASCSKNVSEEKVNSDTLQIDSVKLVQIDSISADTL